MSAATATGPPPRTAASFALPPQAATWDDDPCFGRPSSSPRRLASLPAAAAVSVAAFVFAVATTLVMLALVVAASGHSGISMPVRSAAAVLAGAGFACADAAAVLVLRRGARLHPAAMAAVWALAFVAVVSGAGALGALVPIAGGALAICLGAGEAVRRDPRPVAALLAAACTLSIVAGAIAPATDAHRQASSAAVPAGPDPLPPSVTAAPSPAPATTPTGPTGATPAPASASAAATHAGSRHAATTPTRPTGATPAPATPLSPTDVTAATELVRDFYAALDAHRFAAGWAILSPAVHARFGGFDA